MAARSPETSAEQERLGRYELLCPIARGGMAEVSLARTTGMGGFEKLFVIKRILPQLAHDQEFVRMFLDEARIAASLQHSNVVQTYEVDIVDGTVFSAMEYLHGQDTATIIKRLQAQGRRMPLGAAVAIVLGVSSGLHYAHEQRDSSGRPLGIVHRDVSPHNVIVTYDGGVKVIDFGVAKAANKKSRTRFGMLKGKVGYMSPEQCRCEPLDRRSDVFCIAIMLYELTTGVRLFGGDNEWEVLNAIVSAEIPLPSNHVRDYPSELESIVMRGLRRDPAQRYATAGELHRDLETFARERKLIASSTALAELMADLFDDEITSWRSDERQGISFSVHLQRTLSESDAQTEDAPQSEPASSTKATVAERPRRRRLHRAKIATGGGIAAVAAAAWGAAGAVPPPSGHGGRTGVGGPRRRAVDGRDRAGRRPPGPSGGRHAHVAERGRRRGRRPGRGSRERRAHPRARWRSGASAAPSGAGRNGRAALRWSLRFELRVALPRHRRGRAIPRPGRCATAPASPPGRSPSPRARRRSHRSAPAERRRRRRARPRQLPAAVSGVEGGGPLW